MQRVERHASFGGWQEVWEFTSTTLGTSTRVGVYLPPHAAHRPCPVLWYLSGLTCNEQNVITKSGIQRAAARHGLIVVAPDTSPRGDDVADDAGWDLGQGAGFYVNATQAPWSMHYRMHDFVQKELRALILATFPATDRHGITGHSMGGHGALVLALRNPGAYRSVSAFSPIVAPSEVPWGQKAFRAYLGDDPSSWRAWDACALVRAADERLPILVDVGDADPFLERELQPERLEAACTEVGHPLTLRRQPGYDHSYYFVSTFIDDHIAHHASALLADGPDGSA